MKIWKLWPTSNRKMRCLEKSSDYFSLQFKDLFLLFRTDLKAKKQLQKKRLRLKKQKLRKLQPQKLLKLLQNAKPQLLNNTHSKNNNRSTFKTLSQCQI